MGAERVNNLNERLILRRRLRHKSTPEENALWKLLKNKQIGNSHWYRQFSVGPYVLDFYCPAIRLCIEVDGIHHGEEVQAMKDERRTAYLGKQGIEVLRIPDDVVWNGSDMIIKAIQAYLEQRQ